MMRTLDDRQRAILLAVMIISTMPFWLVSIPPLNDLLGHMGRYHLQLELPDNPLLKQHWDLHWMLIGNLGVDLVMQVVGPIFGVERGAWLVTMAIPPLMIWGLVRLARAYHGHVPPTVVAAFPLVFAYPFQTGLVNFWLAIALAFHASASVIGNSDRWGRPLLLIASSLLLWVCHIFGWAIFAAIVATARIAGRHNTGLFRRLIGLWPLAAPILLMLYQGYGQHSNVVTLGWFAWGHKLTSLVEVMRDQSQSLDLVTLLAVLVPFIVALLFRRQFQLDLRALFAAAVLFAALLVIPYQLFGSAWADARLWPVVLMLLALAVAPREHADPLWTRVIPALILVLFAVRVAVDVVGYRVYDREYSRQLEAIAHVPQGARLAFFISTPCLPNWRRQRLEHIDGIVIIRRDAFTNGQWDVPGAETVEPLAARGTWANSDPSQLVRGRGCKTDMLPELARMTTRLPRNRFDYLWVMGFEPKTVPLYPWLEPIYTNDTAILYRIKK